MEPLVSICCFAYNHKKYITKCMEGFLIQQTNFPFEVIIHDDASTDNTADIIREYSAKYQEFFSPIYQTVNQCSIERGRVSKIVYNLAKGKYIAFCEGDDYWTDPFKLQRQVDFLEANPQYSLVWHRFKKLNQNTGAYTIDGNEKYFLQQNEGVEFDFEKFFKGWEIGMQTLMFRRDAFDLDIIKKYKYFKDTHIITHLLKEGKGYCFDFCGAVYRLHGAGIHTSLSELKASEIGFKTYKELSAKNPGLYYIRKKHEWYAQDYITKLANNNFKTKALFLSICFFVQNRTFWRLKENVNYIFKKKGTLL